MRNKNTICRKIALLLLTVPLCLLAMNAFVKAQEIKKDYKLGDRVECDPNWGKYYKGTIVKVSREGWMYRIKFDDDRANSIVDMELPCLVKQMRPLQATNEAAKEENQNKPETPKTTPDKNTRKPNPDEPQDFTYLADREPIDCPIEQEQVKPNARPEGELLKKVIRCLYERRAPAGITGAKTVDISAFQIGTPRKWRPLDDIGSGNVNTIVYPIKVSWTEKTFYESYTQQIDSISIFNCFVNAVGEWECGLGQRIKESDAKRIPRQQ